MTNQKPIEPLPSRELIIDLWAKALQRESSSTSAKEVFATLLAQWGFNQHAALNDAELEKARDEELDACYEWLCTECYATTAARLRAARRPEPKTQAEKALEALDAFEGFTGSLQEVDVIRAALERLRKLEGGND